MGILDAINYYCLLLWCLSPISNTFHIDGVNANLLLIVVQTLKFWFTHFQRCEILLDDPGQFLYVLGTHFLGLGLAKSAPENWWFLNIFINLAICIQFVCQFFSFDINLNLIILFCGDLVHLIDIFSHIECIHSWLERSRSTNFKIPEAVCSKTQWFDGPLRRWDTVHLPDQLGPVLVFFLLHDVLKNWLKFVAGDSSCPGQILNILIGGLGRRMTAILWYLQTVDPRKWCLKLVERFFGVQSGEHIVDLLLLAHRQRLQLLSLV